MTHPVDNSYDDAYFYTALAMGVYIVFNSLAILAYWYKLCKNKNNKDDIEKGLSIPEPGRPTPSAPMKKINNFGGENPIKTAAVAAITAGLKAGIESARSGGHPEGFTNPNDEKAKINPLPKLNNNNNFHNIV